MKSTAAALSAASAEPRAPTNRRLNRRRYSRLLLLLLLLAGARPVAAQTVRVVKLPELLTLLAQPADTTYIVNFWATWCKPCVEELPGFEAVRAAHAGQNVRMVLVSLDFPSQLTKKIIPFVARQNVGADVWLLAESDANRFIDQIDPSWSGAIPFTLVFNNAHRQRRVFERPLTPAELETAVQEVGRRAAPTATPKTTR